MDQPEYPGSYSIYPGYEMQMQPNMAHKTHTLPHTHSHSHTLERNRTRDDQNLQYPGTMSGRYNNHVSDVVMHVFKYSYHWVLLNNCRKIFDNILNNLEQ